MLPAQSLKSLLLRPLDPHLNRSFQLFLRNVIRGVRTEIERHLTGIRHQKVLTHCRHPAVRALCGKNHGKIKAALAQIPIETNPVIPCLLHAVKKLASPQNCGKADPFLPAGSKTHSHNVRRGRNKHLPLKKRLPTAEFLPVDRLFQIQLPLVIRELFHPLELNVNIAQGLIGMHAVRAAGHGKLDQLLRLRDPSLKNQLPDNGKLLSHIRIIPVNRTSIPHALLVDLDMLPVRTAIYHGAEPAVSKRKRLLPDAGRLPVP